MKNNSVCKENGSNVFRKEREQYHEIQDLKAQMQDKNIAISELKKLIEKAKGQIRTQNPITQKGDTCPLKRQVNLRNQKDVPKDIDSEPRTHNDKRCLLKSLLQSSFLKGQKAQNYDNSDPDPQYKNVVPKQQEEDMIRHYKVEFAL
ncbi:hypothetical protein Tco_0732053 [Tanacetum coccineum]